MMVMAWMVLFQDDFAEEVQTYSEAVRLELIAMADHLAEFGPSAKRPKVDTLKDTRIKNLKEFRFNADNGVWRVAFAFDPRRRAIVLAAGDKSGGGEQKFYARLSKLAEKRMKAFMEAQQEVEEEAKENK